MSDYRDLAREWYEMRSEGWDILDSGAIPSLAAEFERIAQEARAEGAREMEAALMEVARVGSHVREDAPSRDMANAIDFAIRALPLPDAATPASEQPEPEMWRCEGCGEWFDRDTFSHSRPEHHPDCDGSCSSGKCPVEIQCGPIGRVGGA